MNAKIKSSLLPVLAVSCALVGTVIHLPAQSFSSFPEGDDVTSSLGQFQIVLDPAWVKTFDLIVPNSPLGNTMVTRHTRLYHRGVLTSPTLYDPTTTIGRSDPFVAGGPQETNGVLAGTAPGRTYVKDSQLVVRPTWAEATNGVRAIHTFIKSMHLTDSFTTRVGFSVKAGMLAPTRPVCAGEVEGGSSQQDFPARSFFNVYVQVDLPEGGTLPAIQLVNVDPLLVQQTNLFSFPPKLIYIHENSTAVPMYFNKDCVIPDPVLGDIHVTRGTLFGQLTLAGHGVSFSEVEIESFQNEFENESGTGTMPLTPAPLTNVLIQDFSPDYNAVPFSPTLAGGSFAANGAFVFAIKDLAVNSTNYLQASTDLGSGNWQTIATIIPATNTFTYVDQSAVSNRRRFYRMMSLH